jgi:hypothetical protein
MSDEGRSRAARFSELTALEAGLVTCEKEQ